MTYQKVVFVSGNLVKGQNNTITFQIYKWNTGMRA